MPKERRFRYNDGRTVVQNATPSVQTAPVPPATPTVIPSSVVDNPPTTPPITPPTISQDIPNSALGYAKGYYDETTKALQAQQQQTGSQEALLRSLMGESMGRQGALDDATRGAGIYDAQRDLDRRLKNIRLGSDEMQNANDLFTLGSGQRELRASANDITKGTFSAQETKNLRDFSMEQASRAVQLRTQIAEADLLQGDITNAQAQVNAAISAKYDPIDQALQYEQFFLQQQYNQLSTAQKAQADARMGVLQQQQQELTDARNAVNAAVASGGAQPGELEKLMQMSPQDQMAYSNIIQGRVASEDRALQRQQALQSIAASQASIQSSRTSNLIQLAQLGNREARMALGFDPDAPLTKEEREAEEERMAQETQNQSRADSAQATVESIDSILNHPGFNSSVAPLGIGRVAWLDSFGNKDDFIGSVEALTSRQTLDNLINLRASGTTLGALNEKEMEVLEQSATKINSWREVDGDGNVVGYDVSERAFKKELAKLQELARKARNSALGYDPDYLPQEDADVIGQYYMSYGQSATTAAFDPALYFQK